MRSTLGLGHGREETAAAGEQAETGPASAAQQTPDAEQPSTAEASSASEQPTEARSGSGPAPAPEAGAGTDATPPAAAEPAAAAAAMDDGALIAGIAQRDAAALTELYDRHIGPTYSLALRIVGEPGGAEAVVQGVFAQVWSGASQPADAQGVARWLLALTRAHAIRTVRSQGAKDGKNDGGEATVELPSPALGFDDDMGDGPRLRAALDRLSMLQRLCIELAFFDGLTVSQIAARLEQPEERVHKRIRSGLARLREAIGDEG